MPQFQPGQSGNPAGKAKGVRNSASIAIDQLLAGEAETLTRKAVELALSGDTTALKLCLERLVPPSRTRTIQFELPDIATAADVDQGLTALLRATAAGEMTPAEAQVLAQVFEMKRKSIETTAIEERLAQLEAINAPTNTPSNTQKRLNHVSQD